MEALLIRYAKSEDAIITTTMVRKSPMTFAE